jgi:uncharacterized protein (TIRG00374 family)
MIRTLVGVLIGIGILAILLSRIDLQQLSSALWGVHVSLFVVSLSVRVLVMWIKAVRWAITLRGATGRPVYRTFRASMIGFAGNVLLPARLGELARISVLEKHNRIGRSLALATLGVTQLVDLLVLIGYFLVISLCTTHLFSAYRWTLSVLGVIIVCTLSGLAILPHQSQALRVLLSPIRRKVPLPLERLLMRYTEPFVRGLGVLSQRTVAVRVLALTIMVWVLETASAYGMLQAFHIQASVLMAAMVVVGLNLSFVIPITPGNVGVVQALSVFLLGTFGVAQESALAYSIGAEGTACLVVVGLGAVSFYGEKMTLNLFGQATCENTPAHPVPAIQPPHL